MMKWICHHPGGLVSLGFIPIFLSEDDPRPARVQFDSAYIGGWAPMKGWKREDTDRIAYPGDPPLDPIAETKLRDERIFVYRHAFVAIVQMDGSFEVSRMD